MKCGFVKDQIVTKKLKVLWLIHLDYKSGYNSGSNLRYFNFSKELIFKGHEVYFMFNKNETDDIQEKKKYIESLIDNKIITDYFETDHKYPRPLKNMVYLHPILANRFQQKKQKLMKDIIIEIVKNKKIDFFIISNRHFLFILPDMEGLTKIIIDWADSMTLYYLRQIITILRRYKLITLILPLYSLINSFVEERYYGRFCDINLIVSPIDKKYLDYINNKPQKNKVLLNGVNTDVIVDRVKKVKNRIIFTGNMSFPPNKDAAIWFIDKVLPLIRKHESNTKLIIAGLNPNSELLSRASNYIEIAGYVDNISEEIAKSELFVAPMISGGGFKNKVVEAIASGTFLVSTSVGVEFLSSNIREYIIIANRPEEFANAVLYCLNNPEEVSNRLNLLRKSIEGEFSWKHRTAELINLFYETIE
jgi:glycosyltransferase involved in cell wall biosynthesis